METDVVIIGAGPTGLMMACQLARCGVRFIIIDKKSAPTVESRAIVVSTRSLEIYQQLGLSDEAVTNGKKLEQIELMVRGKMRAAVALGEIGKGTSDFPFMLTFEQSLNETLLVKKLEQQHYDVQWNNTFELLTQNEGTVEVKVTNSLTNESSIIKAKYLVACEGAHSPVRHQLKRKFEGGTYENKFYVADTIMEWNIKSHQLVICPGKKNIAIFFPMKGTNAFRLLGTLPPEFADKENVTFEDIEQSLKQTANIPLTIKKVNWFSVYKLHHRCINKFKDGRCFFAGDAAHVHSPAGGQGMNTGLQDAYNLAWKLSYVLKGQANENLLDTYHEERYPVAQFLMRFTDRAFVVMTKDNFFLAWFRMNVASHLLKFLFSSEKLKNLMFKTVSQIGITYKQGPLAIHNKSLKTKLRAGDRLPYLVANGLNIHKLITEPILHLLKIGTTTTTSFNNINVLSFELTNAWKRIGVTEPMEILVRPDLHIIMMSPSIDRKMLQDSLGKYFVF